MTAGAAERDRLKTELVGLHRDYELLAITLASRPGTDLPPFENALTVAPLSYSQQRAIARQQGADGGLYGKGS